MHNFTHVTHKTYRLYFFNLEDVNRGYQRSKVSKKWGKKAKLSLKCQVYAKKLYYTLIRVTGGQKLVKNGVKKDKLSLKCQVYAKKLYFTL